MARFKKKKKIWEDFWVGPVHCYFRAYGNKGLDGFLQIWAPLLLNSSKGYFSRRAHLNLHKHGCR